MKYLQQIRAGPTKENKPCTCNGDTVFVYCSVFSSDRSANEVEIVNGPEDWTSGNESFAQELTIKKDLFLLDIDNNWFRDRNIYYLTKNS